MAGFWRGGRRGGRSRRRSRPCHAWPGHCLAEALRRGTPLGRCLAQETQETQDHGTNTMTSWLLVRVACCGGERSVRFARASSLALHRASWS